MADLGTTTIPPADPSPGRLDGARTWSRRRIAWTAGGTTWLVAALVGAGADDGSGRYRAALVLWLVAQGLLLAGLVALRVEAPAGSRRGGAIGLAVAVLGRVAFAIAELVSLATGHLAEAIYPVAAMATAIGMVVLGVAIVRERRWTGALRWSPLALGVYPFVCMFPVVAAGGSPDLPIGLWGVLAIAVGLAPGSPVAISRVVRGPRTVTG